MREDLHLREEVGLLVDALFESKLNAEQAEQLEELITSDPLAGRYYLEIVGLYEGLSRWSKSLPREEAGACGTTGEKPIADGTICNLGDLDLETLWGITPSDQSSFEENPPAATFGFLGDCFKSGISFLGQNILFLVVLVPLIAISAAVWMSPTLWEPATQRWTLAARVVKTIDCQWKQGSGGPERERFLVTGQKIELEQGLAEIEFSSGARVILQGPAQLIIEGENEATLSSGQLAAVVTQEAKGFTIRAPGMDVVDLGTEFGVAVEGTGKTDVHVFKGCVEMTTMMKSGKTTTVRLKANEAAKYDKTSGKVVYASVDPHKFVRHLDDTRGITTDLKVVNPSFETPDIRNLPEYVAEHGDTEFRAIDGWKVSGTSQTKPWGIAYQISPYYDSPRSGQRFNVGPGATDGRQVASMILEGESPRSYWMYQSLGTVTTVDVGKKLKLSVDAGPRQDFGAPDGKWTMTAGFALNVTPKQRGTILAGTDLSQVRKAGRLSRMEVTMPISVELVGRELFIVLEAGDRHDGPKTQYHFDNVHLVVEE